jgi:prepilin-type N-terminal cleavage/methylation domain-containing protein
MVHSRFLSAPGTSFATRHDACGLTLVELLIALVIGAAVMAGAARVLIGDVRSSSSQEAIQRLREHWGRVNYFVDTEVREGIGVSITAGTGSCSDAANPRLTIMVPAAGATGTIHYYEQAGSIWRCGPDINADGTLDFATITNGILVENATMQTTITNGTNVSYTVELRSRSDAGGLTYSGSSQAHTSGRSCDTTSGICY